MVDQALKNEAALIASKLFAREAARKAFTERVLDTLEKVRDKDFLVIHNPGGWGSSTLDRCLDWERSIVEGVKSTIDRLGYSSTVTQYFRTRDSVWAHFLDMKEQIRFFLRGVNTQARTLAAELRFITRHADGLKVVMVGVSQGAGFSNAVMRQLSNDGARVYSIELGTMFVHVPRRMCNERTLAIDSNGVAPDPYVRRDLWAGARAYSAAPFVWLKYELMRKPRRFTHCVIMPGHDYRWDYPGVGRRIESFLTSRFARKPQETRV